MQWNAVKIAMDERVLKRVIGVFAPKVWEVWLVKSDRKCVWPKNREQSTERDEANGSECRHLRFNIMKKIVCWLKFGWLVSEWNDHNYNLQWPEVNSDVHPVQRIVHISKEKNRNKNRKRERKKGDPHRKSAIRLHCWFNVINWFNINSLFIWFHVLLMPIKTNKKKRFELLIPMKVTQLATNRLFEFHYNHICKLFSPKIIYFFSNLS